MTRTRYTINDRGELVSRDGEVLGKLTSLTLETEGRRGTTGGGGVPSQEQRQLTSKGIDKAEGGAGETSVTDELVAAVWRYWCQARKPKRTDLEPAQAKLIAKGLNAGFTTIELCAAIDGLLASTWHRDNRKLQLSSILATRPGGPTLRDQIDGWIERSPSSPSSGAVTSQTDVRAGRVAALKADVMRGWHRDPSRPAPSRDAQERAAEAIDSLKAFGITVRFALEDDGKPVFE